MNLLEYLATEFASFEEKPFNPVDSAALSQLCMVCADGIVPALRERKSFLGLGMTVENLLSTARGTVHFHDLLRAEHYATMFTGLTPDLIKENLLALAASPRFRELTLRDSLSLFDTEHQTQFAALTFVYKKEFAYVGFRGTDTSFVGWRENLNMAYTSPVPAQDQAARYLATVAPRLPKRLFVGGHSKGGNLAVYAALRANDAIAARIERVFNHDGPGFKPGLFTANDYARFDGRFHKTVPQECIVGMLMESFEQLRVVKSNGSGIMTHSPFTWEIDEDDFVYADDLSEPARFANDVFTQWLASFSDAELAVIINAFFEAVEASGAQNAADLLSGGAGAVKFFVEATKRTDGPTRDILRAAIKVLTDIAVKSFGQSILSGRKS